MDKKYCKICREHHYIYQILDSNGNTIDCKINATHTDTGENLVQFVLDLNDIQLSDGEKNMILDLIKRRVDYGGDIFLIEKYLRLYEKISRKKIV